MILSPLEKALESLKKVLLEPENDITRDSAIKRFEYTYELSWKFLKRYLEEVSPTPSEIDSYSFKDLIRTGFEVGVIRDVETWFGYREARNKTSHTYNETTAKDVYRILKDFAVDVDFLLGALKKND